MSKKEDNRSRKGAKNIEEEIYNWKIETVERDLLEKVFMIFCGDRHIKVGEG